MSLLYPVPESIRLTFIKVLNLVSHRIQESIHCVYFLNKLDGWIYHGNLNEQNRTTFLFDMSVIDSGQFT